MIIVIRNITGLAVLIGGALLLVNSVFGFDGVRIEDGGSHSLEELESLPYLAWAEKPDMGASGVVKYDKHSAFAGYNLYTDNVKNVYLMGMAGRIVYRWRLPDLGRRWEHVELLDDGSIVALCDGTTLMKLDRDSQIVWKLPLAAHHDIAVLVDGTFLVPAVKAPVKYGGRCVSFDEIVHVSKDGKVLGKWSTYQNLQDLQNMHRPSLLDEGNFDRAAYWRNLHMAEMALAQGECAVNSYREWFDYYHLNSIQVLPQTGLGLKDKRFQEGNWLVCFRNVDLICILDKDTHKPVWGWGPGILDGPHMPRMLKDGRILMYDNGYHRPYSRIIMVDPGQKKIVWKYEADPQQNYHSKQSGSVQILLNGDFLICESEKGHVFEITPDGRTVWEFLNPQVNKDHKRKTIYRMIRIPPGKVEGWLAAPGPKRRESL
jgi:hypothetical protein